MFGFIFGSACVAGLVAMAARRHRHHGFHRHGRGHRGFGRRALYRFLSRLDTTPGQDKAILAAIDDMRDAARDVAEEMWGVRKHIAEAFRAEHLDEAAFAAAFDEPLRRVSALRDELTKNAATVHEALTQKQRERVADVVASPTRWGYGYGYAC